MAALVALAVSVAADLAVVVLVDSKIFSIHSLAAVVAVLVDPNAPRQGADLQYTIQLKFEEAIFGVEKEIKYNREDTCATVAVICQTRHTPRNLS